MKGCILCSLLVLIYGRFCKHVIVFCLNATLAASETVAKCNSFYFGTGICKMTGCESSGVKNDRRLVCVCPTDGRGIVRVKMTGEVCPGREMMEGELSV